MLNSSSSSLPRQDSPSIFLPSLFNLSSDMFHGVSKVAAKAVGGQHVTEGLAGYFEGMMVVWVDILLDASNSRASSCFILSLYHIFVPLTRIRDKGCTCREWWGQLGCECEREWFSVYEVTLQSVQHGPHLSPKWQLGFSTSPSQPLYMVHGTW